MLQKIDRCQYLYHYVWNDLNLLRRESIDTDLKKDVPFVHSGCDGSFNVGSRSCYVCSLGIGISSVLSTYMRNLDVNQLKKGPTAATTTSSSRSRRGDDSSTYPRKNEIAFGVVCMMTFFLMTYVFHCTWVTSEAYSSPSIVLSARSGDGSKYIFDDFREAYWWLRYNTPEVKSKVLRVLHPSTPCFRMPK